MLASYEEKRDLITLGAYAKGSDPRVDRAISAFHMEAIRFRMYTLGRLLNDPAYAALAADLRGDILFTMGRTDEARAAYKLALEKSDARSPSKGLTEMKLGALGGGGFQQGAGLVEVLVQHGAGDHLDGGDFH